MALLTNGHCAVSDNGGCDTPRAVTCGEGNPVTSIPSGLQRICLAETIKRITLPPPPPLTGHSEELACDVVASFVCMRWLLDWFGMDAKERGNIVSILDGITSARILGVLLSERIFFRDGL
ncbi:hypothetical protein CEXT_802681 [Caerostris extrusa]|uniref:Uncharacterized protein n=1 Tax=Caerostris extrusa TaxID=172846 RepID=A0AAV4NTL0_CAEEX|nr:hypothetical protein CEXT_802681 [Caerostris extrusa]